ncbi:response regulator transcription factor [Amycolatopsis sp. NPDC059021]|uniref:helix-turn-helix transcriptional regulator n=1 Tax=Amycolatopsis sp. NPDC059021 TaxID=3346704 RepID=UPI00367186EF
MTTPITLGQALAKTLPVLQRVTGLAVTFGGSVTGDTLVIDQLRGTQTRSLENLRVAAGAGLGGKALALSRISTVTDYLSAKSITHSYDRAVAPERIGTMLAVPVRTGAATRAVLYAGTRAQVPIGDRVLRAALDVVARLERDILVEEEVRRRLAVAPAPGTLAAGDVRELRAELVSIAAAITDEDTRAALLKVCDRLEPPAPATGLLSPRETEVLEQAGLGCTNDEISANLGLLPNTVKSYLKHAMRKLDVTNRIQAVNKARSLGLLR